ncbi:MAG: hypothetical protein HY785_09840 [Oscillatoriophycideae cyanobacterium NC_groundwater_1537_Pr4_S-0.65um_50_18]|nr:hypothetical protein [Oscillatoriophycideae cyanobacterium NC_groundwater_1537_Pr4_S-0.65um_50_18]
MPTLVNITSGTPDAVQIWGFYGSITVKDVAEAVKTIASGLSGDGHEIHIMSGTHGYCSGQIGAVATREQKFAEEDRSLSHPETQDGKQIVLVVRDFHTGEFVSAPDPVTAAMSKLNTDIRNTASSNPDKVTFLLAYCCSAGSLEE